MGDGHEGQKKARIKYFQTKVVAMECGGRVLTEIADLPGRGTGSIWLNVMLHRLSVKFLPGRLGNVRLLLHVPGLLENALVAVALQAAEYATVLVGQKSIKAVEMFEGLHAADWPPLCPKRST